MTGGTDIKRRIEEFVEGVRRRIRGITRVGRAFNYSDRGLGDCDRRTEAAPRGGRPARKKRTRPLAATNYRRLVAISHQPTIADALRSISPRGPADNIESTVKQINRRVKGSEKFWNSNGADDLLQLSADCLSETNPLTPFWRQRKSATGQRATKPPLEKLQSAIYTPKTQSPPMWTVNIIGKFKPRKLPIVRKRPCQCP